MARIAGEDHGVVSRPELLEAGVSAAQVDQRLRSGALLPEYRGSTGSGTARGEARVTLSTMEKRFLALLREAGLPLPRTNRPAGSKRVDCRWPEHRLTVELDSYHYHSSRHAWEQDRRREREARARGDEFRRYTYGDVCERPRAMLAELRGLLSRG